jgi:hypothetical protein
VNDPVLIFSTECAFARAGSKARRVPNVEANEHETAHLSFQFKPKVLNWCERTPGSSVRNKDAFRPGFFLADTALMMFIAAGKSTLPMEVTPTLFGKRNDTRRRTVLAPLDNR